MSAETAVSETSHCLCLASRKAARRITRAFEKEFRPLDLRATQFTVLSILEIRGTQTIGQLANLMGVERTTLTRNLARLETRGLIEIRPGEDARSRCASITRQGSRLLAKALPIWRRVQAMLTQSMGASMADTLRRVARSPSIG